MRTGRNINYESRAHYQNYCSTKLITWMACWRYPGRLMAPRLRSKASGTYSPTPRLQMTQKPDACSPAQGSATVELLHQTRLAQIGQNLTLVVDLWNGPPR